MTRLEQWRALRKSGLARGYWLAVHPGDRWVVLLSLDDPNFFKWFSSMDHVQLWLSEQAE